MPLTKKYNSNGFRTGKQDAFPWLPIALFIFAVCLLWDKITKILSPDTYKAQVQKPVEAYAMALKNTGALTADGYFISGTGVKQKYGIEQASRDAEKLAVLLRTTKNDNWFSRLRVFTLGIVTETHRIKAILNPNYVAAYRRTVVALYRDVFTEKRSLLADCRTTLADPLANIWTTDLDKYFTL